MANASYDAVVVGSGPNGLAAAICLARHKLKVLVLEAKPEIGGGTRSAELTLPGFTHDVCSAVHPLGVGSPCFQGLPLQEHGLQWIHPDVPLAHPMEAAVLLRRSVEATAAELGTDAGAYRALFATLVAHWHHLAPELLRPLVHWPRRPILMSRFGLRGVRSAVGLANSCFKSPGAKALFAGMAAHSFLALEQVPSAAFGLILGTAGHAVGWPIARGGSQSIANALASYLRSLGGEIETGVEVKGLEQLPKARAVLLDVTPRGLLRLAGGRLPARYRQRLEDYRYGPGVFKIDYALSGPIPWKAANCAQSVTVHLGGTMEEIATAECEVSSGKHPDRPFVLLAQPSLFDDSRAPAGKHVAWAYCHVPSGSSVDMTDRIETQIERFAPGFRDLVLARHTMNCAQLEQRNSNCVGGDINGGLASLRQLIIRPVLGLNPYRTPLKGLYLCSSSTPPGGGVHGMCGWLAGQAALKELFK